MLCSQGVIIHCDIACYIAPPKMTDGALAGKLPAVVCKTVTAWQPKYLTVKLRLR